MTDHTDFGDRMKMYESYETNRKFLPLLPVYARIDGKCFSKFTKDMAKPFNADLSMLMIDTAKYLVKETNAKIAYTQSDEISLCWHSDTIGSEIFFDGKIFKMTSILASIATAFFVRYAIDIWPEKLDKILPTFDARVIQLPNKIECANMFLWREKDATKNAINSAARCFYSHKELYKKSTNEMQEMLFKKGINFNNYPDFFKRGSFVSKKIVQKSLTPLELSRIPVKNRPTSPIYRNTYNKVEMPPFKSVENKVGVIFDGEDPMLIKEENNINK